MLKATKFKPAEVAVFVRTSTWSGSSEALDKWADHVTIRVAPMVRGLAGVAGAVFVIDRVGHSAMTVTLWETEEAALVSDQHAEASRSATVAATGVELVTRGRYEVVTKF